MVARMFYGTDPFSEMRRLQSEMSRLMQASAPLHAPEFPAMNAYANQDGVVLTAELPGVDPERLDIAVHRDTLTLRGERPGEADEAKLHRRERLRGKFLRTLGLPFMVDPEKVEARFENGVLRLTLQRSEEDKPKRIQIGSAGKSQKSKKAESSPKSGKSSKTEGTRRKK